MSKKLLLQDLVDLLVSQQKNLSKKKADGFVRSFFQIIEDGLKKDKFAKIKGIGTFKLVIIDSRESVDVNTGERIEIKSHARISFTPDTLLKDSINHPFAHLQTVTLSDDTALEEFDEVDKRWHDTEAEEIEDDAAEEDESQPMREDRQSALVNTSVAEVHGKEADAAETVTLEPLEASQHDARGNKADAHAGSQSVADTATSNPPATENASTSAGTQNEQALHADKTADKTKQLDVDKTLPENKNSQAEKNTEMPKKNDVIAPAEETSPSETLSRAQQSNTSRPQSMPNRTASNPEKEQETTGERHFSKDAAEDYSELDNNKRPNWWKIIAIGLISLIIIILSYFAGYFRVFCPCESPFFGGPKAVAPATPPINRPAQALAPKESPQKPADSNTVSTAQPSATPQSQPVQPVQKKPDTLSPQQPAAKVTTVAPNAKTPTDEAEKYRQLPGGKYKIVGTLRTHVIQPGETLRTIAQEVYGSKGYVDYIIVHNRISDPDLIKKGMALKLPKLVKKS